MSSRFCTTALKASPTTTAILNSTGPAFPRVSFHRERPENKSGAAPQPPSAGRVCPLANARHPAGVPNSRARIEEGLSQELSLQIEGMWCVACSWLIEQLLRKMDGVLSAGIFFFSDIARIRYMPHCVQPQAIMESISRLGYKASPVESPPDSGPSRDLVVRLGVSAILCMNVMMISFALWAGFFEEIGREERPFFHTRSG